MKPQNRHLKSHKARPQTAVDGALNQSQYSTINQSILVESTNCGSIEKVKEKLKEDTLKLNTNKNIIIKSSQIQLKKEDKKVVRHARAKSALGNDTNLSMTNNYLSTPQHDGKVTAFRPGSTLGRTGAVMTDLKKIKIKESTKSPFDFQRNGRFNDKLPYGHQKHTQEEKGSEVQLSSNQTQMDHQSYITKQPYEMQISSKKGFFITPSLIFQSKDKVQQPLSHSFTQFNNNQNKLQTIQQNTDSVQYPRFSTAVKNTFTRRSSTGDEKCKHQFQVEGQKIKMEEQFISFNSISQSYIENSIKEYSSVGCAVQEGHFVNDEQAHLEQIGLIYQEHERIYINNATKKNFDIKDIQTLIDGEHIDDQYHVEPKMKSEEQVVTIQTLKLEKQHDLTIAPPIINVLKQENIDLEVRNNQSNSRSRSLVRLAKLIEQKQNQNQPRSKIFETNQLKAGKLNNKIYQEVKKLNFIDNQRKIKPQQTINNDVVQEEQDIDVEQRENNYNDVYGQLGTVIEIPYALNQDDVDQSNQFSTLNHISTKQMSNQEFTMSSSQDQEINVHDKKRNSVTVNKNNETILLSTYTLSTPNKPNRRCKSVAFERQSDDQNQKKAKWERRNENVCQEEIQMIDEAVQMRVQYTIAGFKEIQAKRRLSGQAVREMGRLTTAVRMKNGGMLFNQEKVKCGMNQSKEHRQLIARATSEMQKRDGQSVQKREVRPLIELESSTDYAESKSNHGLQSVFNKTGKMNIKFNKHFKKAEEFNSFQETIPAQKLLGHKEYGSLENTKSIKRLDQSRKQVPIEFDFESQVKSLSTTKTLRYTKFQRPKAQKDQDKDKDSILFGDENYFERNNVISNKIRSIYEKNYSQIRKRKTAGMLEEEKSREQKDKEQNKPKLTKQQELSKLGDYPILYTSMKDNFDPLRLKIIMLKKGEANPFGKNPDYFFVKGIDYLTARDCEQAIKCFAKGVHDKGTHFLCRFNLGYALFKVGHFQSAVQQFEIIVHQALEFGLHPKSKLTSVFYNKAVCEIQCGYYPQAVESAKNCLVIVKEQAQTHQGSVIDMPRKFQEMIISALQIQGIAYFRWGRIKDAGIVLEAADVRLAMIEQQEIDTNAKRENLKHKENTLSKSSLSAINDTDQLKIHKSSSKVVIPKIEFSNKQQKSIKNMQTFKNKIIEKVNQNLNLDNIIINDKQLEGQKNYKIDQDTFHQKNYDFMQDFKHRLHICIAAAAEGQDEVRAFRDGMKMDLKKDDSEIKLYQNRLTHRNNQRNKSANLLEMEVEKDLIKLFQILTKKKFQSKNQNKENQLVRLEDQEEMKQLVLALCSEKTAVLTTQYSPSKFSPSSPGLSFSKEKQRSSFQVNFQEQDNGKCFQYSAKLLNQLIDQITKFREIREQYDDEKRIWMLQNGNVDYMCLKRGTILYEQDISKADSYYLIISGKVTIVKTFVNEELMYNQKNEKRIKKIIEGEDSLSIDSILNETPVNNNAFTQNLKAYILENVSEQVSDNSSSSSQQSKLSYSDFESVSLTEESMLRGKKEKQVKKNNIITSTSLNMTTKQTIIPDNHKYAEFFTNFDNEVIKKKSEIQSQKPQQESEILKQRKNDYWGKRKDRRLSDFQYEQIKDPYYETQQHQQQNRQIKLKQQSIDQEEKKKLELFQQQTKINITEQNYYAGQLFSNEQYLHFRKMKFVDKMVWKIERLVFEKTKLDGHVKEMEKENLMAELEAEKQFQKLSYGRRGTIMLSAKKESSKSLLSPVKKLSSQNLNLSLNQGGSALMRKLKESLGNIVINPTKNSPNSQESLSPSPLTVGKKTSLASPIPLQRRGTEYIQDRIEGYSKRQKALEKLKQIKEAEKADSIGDSEDSLGDEGPYPLKQMKRQNTALVMLDDTLIIRIPYKLERGYIKHLENMEKQQMDI